MRLRIVPCALLVTAIAAAPGLRAQSATTAKPKISPFWLPVAPSEMTLTFNVQKVREKCLGPRTIAFGSCDNKQDSAPWVPATVSYTEKGATVSLAARVRARGLSRLRTCDLVPPLWVDFKGADTKKHVFARVKRFKLVLPCKAAPEFERYVVEEYNIYRLHALMTSVSHLTRLIHLTVVDSASRKGEFTKYAFAVEDATELASRVGGTQVRPSAVTADNLDAYQAALIGVLQYMIGNTDFSIYALHNAELVRVNGIVYPVANDFDQAGVIAPPYATPDPRLGIKSVRERLYRGLCVPRDTVLRVLSDLRDKRAAVVELYRDDIGKRIGGNGAAESIRWFDDFYADISSPDKVQSQILDKCQGAQ